MQRFKKGCVKKMIFIYKRLKNEARFYLKKNLIAAINKINDIKAMSTQTLPL